MLWTKPAREEHTGEAGRKAPASFAIEVDGQPVASNLQGATYELDLSKLKPGIASRPA
jgi:hypothetical protein